MMSRDILTNASCSVLLAWYDDAISEKNSKAGARGGADGCSVVFRWALEDGAEEVSPLRFISMRKGNAAGFRLCYYTCFHLFSIGRAHAPAVCAWVGLDASSVQN
jgi:hypothetical protein